MHADTFDNDKVGLMNYLLKHVVSALNDNKIPYYLDCGTLLGCIREGTIMEKDTDVDVTIHLSLWDKLINIDFEKYGLVKTRTLEKHHGIAYLVSVNFPNSDMWCDIYANPAFPLLTETSLNNEIYTIPREPELYLSKLYGNWKVSGGEHAEWPELFYRHDRLITSNYSKNWDLAYEIKKF